MRFKIVCLFVCAAMSGCCERMSDNPPPEVSKHRRNPERVIGSIHYFYGETDRWPDDLSQLWPNSLRALKYDKDVLISPLVPLVKDSPIGTSFHYVPPRNGDDDEIVLFYNVRYPQYLARENIRPRFLFLLNGGHKQVSEREFKRIVEELGFDYESLPCGRVK